MWGDNYVFVFQCAGPVCDCKRNSDVRQLFKIKLLTVIFFVLTITNTSEIKLKEFLFEH